MAKTFYAVKADGFATNATTEGEARRIAVHRSSHGPNYYAKVRKVTRTKAGDSYETIAHYTHGREE